METLNTTYCVASLTVEELKTAYSHLLSAKKLSKHFIYYYTYDEDEIIENLEEVLTTLHFGNLIIHNENDPNEQFMRKQLNTIYIWVDSAISGIKGRSNVILCSAIDNAVETFEDLFDTIR
jgi:hypothetical protein